MKKILSLIALLVLVLAGCGSAADARITTPNELTINGDYVIPPTTHGNPYAGGFIGGGVEPYLYDPLFIYSASSDEKFVPHLADSYTQDGNTITITIKDGITWSDGSPITAQDVANSYYMWVGKKQVWEYLKTINVVDDQTLEFIFKVESPLMMNLISDVRIEAYPTEYTDWAADYKQIADNDREWHDETNSFWYTEDGQDHLQATNNEVEAYHPAIESIITSGPFTVDSITTSELLLHKNENYFNQISFDSLKIIRTITPETAASAMVDGTLDLHSGGMNNDLDQQVAEKLGDSYHEFFIPEYSQMGIVFNMQDELASKREFREAIGYLIDRETILPLAEVGSLPSEQGASGLPKSLQELYGLDNWAEKNTHNFTYDPEQAAQILTDAGWTKKDDGYWYTPEGNLASFELACNNGWGSAIIPGEAISNSLNDFGFDVTYRPMEGAAYDEYITSGEHQVAIEFAPPSNVIYAHPYGTYEQLYKGRAWLFGLKADDNGQLLVDAPDGSQVDVIALTNQLFFAQSDEEVKEITKQLMEITDYNVFFIPYLEKGFPIRTLKDDIDFGVEDGSLVLDERFSGVDSTTFARLISEGQLKPQEA